MNNPTDNHNNTGGSSSGSSGNSSRKSSEGSCSGTNSRKNTPPRKFSLPEKVGNFARKGLHGIIRRGMSPKQHEGFYYKVHVKTGDKLGAGTDSNVFLIIEDSEGRKTEKKKLDHHFVDDHERGMTYVYDIQPAEGMTRAHMLRLSRDSKGFGDCWYPDYIKIEHVNADYDNAMFPVQRWVKANREYLLREYDSSLPQHSHDKMGRRKELEEKRLEYIYSVKIEPNGPVQVKSLPADEKFALDFIVDFLKEKAGLISSIKWIDFTQSNWKSMEDLRKVYKVASNLPPPHHALDHWREDVYFGLNRIQGINPTVIKLCTEIPKEFGVTSEMVSPFMDGMTIEEAMAAKLLFIVDYEILEGLYTQEGTTLCSPFALFFLKNNIPLPVAIQLIRNKEPCDNNPVFTPGDDHRLWTIVKMWFNNADASYHQASAHLGLTHLIMEGVCVCTHRNLSPSHPLFKLLAPHFLYLLAINSRGLEQLICPGGWIDKTMAIGIPGAFQLISRACERWNFMEDGCVVNQVANRGLTEDVLPYYPYREDSHEIFVVLKEYCRKMINLIYPDEASFKEDFELRDWRLDMTRPKNQGGLGMHGFPGDDREGFTSVDQIIDTVSVILSVCSVGHAAANFMQYDAYAFPPAFPAMLAGEPPCDKSPRTEEDILKLIPSKSVTLDVMAITRLLSRKGTQKLGDFEVEYLFDPKYRMIVDEFRQEMSILEEKFKEKHTNGKRYYTYDCLDPNGVPNSISI